LLEVIAELEGPERIRLSSIEPTDFTDRLIDLIADPLTRVCPHVHIPLQSGDERILGLMCRRYSSSFYADTVMRIAEHLPGCGIGADVMVGFPGEDEQAFRATYDLIDRLPLTYLHVFSFSRRYATPASRMPDQVDAPARKRRSRILRELGQRKSAEFRRSLIGSTLPVLVLGTLERGMAAGLSGNYVRFLIEDTVEPNTIAACRVTAVGDTGVKAVTCGDPSACNT
jgi:threonylcarbamoyladenosine tRNA methylthiotransferase MtaB